MCSSSRVMVVVSLGIALAVIGAVGATGAVAGQDSENETDRYDGNVVEFEHSDDTVTNVTVGGEDFFTGVSVGAQNGVDVEVGDELDLDLDPEIAELLEQFGDRFDHFEATDVGVEVGTEGSASVTVTDSQRGTIAVDAGEQDQYVGIDLAEGAEAREEDDRVVVESGDRTGVFVGVGESEIQVDDDGVVVDLGQRSDVIFRSYADGERGEHAIAVENMIANGTATADVFVDDREGEPVADVSVFDDGLSVETDVSSDDRRVDLTVDRESGEGTVVATTVNESVLGGTDVSVSVDGEAAVEADSHADLEDAIDGDEPRYLVVENEESGTVDVLVAVDHFSERQITIEPADDEEDEDGMPGFGVTATLLAILLGAGAARRR